MKTSIAVGGVVIALLAVGCGGGAKKASPEKYVSTVCSSISVWEKALAADTQKFQSAVGKLSGTPDFAKLKAQLTDYLGTVVAATKQMQSNIEAVGEPNVKNGAKIEKAVNSGLSSMVAGLVKAEKRAGALSITSLTQLASEAQSLGKAVSVSGSKISSTLSSLTSAELTVAAKNDPACKKLGS